MARDNVNILFLTLYPGTVASPRYRVEQFVPHLTRSGIRCSVQSALTASEYERLSRGRAARYHLLETRRRIAQLLRARAYDLVFVQKGLMTAYLRGMDVLLRKRARRVVFDFDDAVHLAPPHSLRGIWRALEDREQIADVMRNASLVLAGNAWLCDEARAHALNVALFPTVVDTERFKPAARAADGLVAGWIGGTSTTPHLQAAACLADIPNLRLHCIGADREQTPWKSALHSEWRFDTEVEALQQFDIGVMPLPKTDWSRGKCALKALQYMACGIPCVATPFGAVLEFGRHNENLLFADSPLEWREAIEHLRDPRERARIGEAGRETVLQSYSLHTAAPRLMELLRSVL